jgi:glutamate racemase
MIPDSYMRRPIAIFDSGIGGLSYLEPARAALPNESFVYLADRAGFPYGIKTHEEVRGIVLALVERIAGAYDPKAVVIACNTASQAGLEAARMANPGLLIVGTVPAIKPAAERTRSGTIGVMATEGAVEDPYLDALVARYAKGVNVIREAAQSLVAFVERRGATASPEERREAVRPFVRSLVERGADEIVLACTHFLHLRGEIAEVAGPGVEIIDSRSGVVDRLRQVLTERGLLEAAGPVGPERGLLEAAGPVDTKRAREPSGIFLLSGEAPFETEYGLLAEAFHLLGPCALGEDLAQDDEEAWTG